MKTATLARPIRSGHCLVGAHVRCHGFYPAVEHHRQWSCSCSCHAVEAPALLAPPPPRCPSCQQLLPAVTP